MAEISKKSKSFLREDSLIAISDITADENLELRSDFLTKVFERDKNTGKLIRSKQSIRDLCIQNGVKYRMIFNAMNMRQYNKEDIKEAIEHLSDFINDLGVGGIVEFHAADMTQNSDHLHFWITSEDKNIYNAIANEMVFMGYTNKEDVYIQAYEENKPIPKEELVKDVNTSVKERFIEAPTIGKENTEIIQSIYQMLNRTTFKREKIMPHDEIKEKVDQDDFIKETNTKYEQFLQSFTGGKTLNIQTEKGLELTAKLNSQKDSLKNLMKNRQK